MNIDWKLWALAASAVAIIIAAVTAGNERDHLTKQQDGIYK